MSAPDDTINAVDQHGLGASTSTRALIAVAQSRGELPTPASTSLYAQCAALIHDHYDDVVDLVRSVAGETIPAMHGSPKWARIRLILKLRQLAEDGGHAALADLDDAAFERTVVFGYRRTAQHSFRQLERQGRRLMVEFRRAIAHLPQAAE